MEYVDLCRLEDPNGLSLSAEKALVSHNRLYSKICFLLSTDCLKSPLVNCSELLAQSDRYFDELLKRISASGLWREFELNTFCIKRKAMRDAIDLLVNAFPIENEDKFLFYLEMFWTTQRVFFSSLISLHGQLMMVKKQFHSWAM
jgi:hypothetical protein